ncbi:hypothetical protein J2780_002410 [Chryseobacterium camelliae]|nr:hypothetical protein [Chryseobacterium camelliae]
MSLYIQNLHFVPPKTLLPFLRKRLKNFGTCFFLKYNHKKFYADFESDLLMKGKNVGK